MIGAQNNEYLLSEIRNIKSRKKNNDQQKLKILGRQLEESDNFSDIKAFTAKWNNGYS